MTESVPKLRILTIRDQRVLLDADLARLYGVETRALNQAVKRNLDRFPEEFAFALARDEILRISQTVTSLRRIKFSKRVQVPWIVRQRLPRPSNRSPCAQAL
jgi:hypothetical protein